MTYTPRKTSYLLIVAMVSLSAAGGLLAAPIAHADVIPVESTSGFHMAQVTPLDGYALSPIGTTFNELFTKTQLNAKLFDAKDSDSGAVSVLSKNNVSVKKGKLELASQNGVGAQVISKKLYTYGTFTMKAKANTDTSMSSIMYLYGESNDGNTHEEIDFELTPLNANQVSISNNHDDDWSNTDAQNEFHRDSIVDTKSVAGLGALKSTTKYNTYKLEWMPGVIRWYINGKRIAQQTEAVPTTPMELHLATYHMDWPGFLSNNTSGKGTFFIDSFRYVSDSQAAKVPLTTKKMQVKGDADCKSNVNAALNQLKSEPWHYNFVVGYVDLIECVETGSVMWVWETPRRHTAGRPYRDDAVQFASDLVHEACHSFQYTSYHEQHPKEDVPELVYSQHDAEETCLNYQTDYLRRIGEKERADGYNDAMATEWWKVDTKDMTY
ncbi:glycoside hydrolase family 16 protein [Candidatus Gracilibacteria bacterium]|nr:glycoside hydrolase family 16 protein [Candidatus Gracilibacteria bacterium]